MGQQQYVRMLFIKDVWPDPSNPNITRALYLKSLFTEDI